MGDDVAELAQERLPDRFVSEALGLDLKEHYQQLAVAHERMVREAEEAATAASGTGFLAPIPAEVARRKEMANKKKQERDGWGVKKKMQIAPVGAKEKETKPKQKKSSWKRWEVDENDIETKETKEEGATNPQGGESANAGEKEEGVSVGNVIGGASALTAVALSHNNKKKETYSSNDDSDEDGSELSFNTSSEDGDRSSDSPQEEISGSESESGSSSGSGSGSGSGSSSGTESDDETTSLVSSAKNGNMKMSSSHLMMNKMKSKSKATQEKLKAKSKKKTERQETFNGCHAFKNRDGCRLCLGITRRPRSTNESDASKNNQSRRKS